MPVTEIIKSQLHAPTLAPGSIVRSRLLRRLDDARDLPLTLLSAPAGYGKSVLASQWLASRSTNSAWVSLAPRDDGLGVFTSYLVEAVESSAPGTLAGTRTMLGRADTPPIGALTSSLLNELDVLQTPITIVIDDYHLIGSPQIHRLVAGLCVQHPPSVRLVLLTRHDPPLPLAVLRGHAQIAELRARDLRFTIDETSAFSASVLGNPVPDAVARSLFERTEGWPAGLRLSLEAMRYEDVSADDPPTVAPLDAVRVHEYLACEVLDAQPDWIREHLLRTSIPDRFCRRLCDELEGAAPGKGTGERFIRWLVARELFVIPLGGNERWFRYHHIFRDLLRGQLEARGRPERAIELHRCAGAWFEAEGRVDDALEHALEGGDPTRAARIVATHGNDLVDLERWAELERWISRLPEPLVGADPDILLLQAWTYEALDRRRELIRTLDRAEDLVGAGRPADAADVTLGSIAVLRGHAAFMGGDLSGGIALARRGEALIPSRYERHLTRARVLLAGALQATGDAAAAVASARSAMSEMRFRRMRLPAWTWALSRVYWLEGDMVTYASHAAALREAGERSGLVGARASGDYHRGASAYQRNLLPEAEHHFAAASRTQQTVRPVVHLQSSIGLALVLQARGRERAADDVVESLTAVALQSGNEFVLATASAFQAELAIRRGQMGAALEWTEHAPQPAELQEWMNYSTSTTYLKALIVGDRDLAAARAGCARLLAFAERVHNRPLTIVLLGLQAMALDASGRDADAARSLHRAVALAQPGQVVRLLADLGPTLVPLLNRIDADGEVLVHVAAIILAIESPPEDDRDVPDAVREAPSGVDLGLTRRELEVLRLLDRRLANKEIAAELLISAATVKKYTMGIYRKLHVAGRRDAVAKARALGYLDPVSS